MPTGDSIAEDTPKPESGGAEIVAPILPEPGAHAAEPVTDAAADRARAAPTAEALGPEDSVIGSNSRRAQEGPTVAPTIPPEPIAPRPITPSGPPPVLDADAAPQARSGVKPKRRLRWGRALLIVLAVLVLWPPLSVLALRVVAPPVTILMLLRLAEGRGLDKAWRPLDRISPSLATAVIAAEDAQFCEHRGFDWDAMRAAAERNARSPNKVRGGSTISQQTAKNVFLWPSRDYLRKGLEAGYTVLIETLWGKRRILETYLNVVEWGPGTYGAQAAAQRYFHEDASALTPPQSARLAAILPSPLRWNAANPGRYVARRSRSIGANARTVRADDLAWCVRR